MAQFCAATICCPYCMSLLWSHLQAIFWRLTCLVDGSMTMTQSPSSTSEIGTYSNSWVAWSYRMTLLSRDQQESSKSSFTSFVSAFAVIIACFIPFSYLSCIFGSLSRKSLSFDKSHRPTGYYPTEFLASTSFSKGQKHAAGLRNPLASRLHELQSTSTYS